MNHYLECEAPICSADPNPDYKKEVIWYPGELVCGKTPYQKFQKRQSEINRYVKKGNYRDMDLCWTAERLERGTIFGINPESAT